MQLSFLVTKEFSFVSTLNSAALVFKLREACLLNDLEFCQCSEQSSAAASPHNETHQFYTDCQEMRRLPKDIARKFTDKPLLPADKRFYLQTAVLLHNNFLGRKVCHIVYF